MAKSVKRGALGREPAREPAPTTPDAIEIAMEAEASGVAPDGVARRVLERQVQLIGWQIAGERASFALKALTGVAGVGAAAVVIALLWSASHYRGLTIQPFSAPPELEARGLTGSAIATRMLDKLTLLQSRTISIRAANTYANSWGDSVEVQIPETGVSAGELWRFLRSWLGQEVKITGEVARVDGGLRLTARAGGEPTEAVISRQDDLEDALDKAAEGIFARTQPYRYAIYLSRDGRVDESIAALATLATSADPIDRKWALAAWSLQLQSKGEWDQSIARAEQAIALDPRFGLAHANLGGVLGTVGRSERACEENRLAAENIGRGPDLNQALIGGFRQEMKGAALTCRHDHAGAAAAYAVAAQTDGASGRSAQSQQAFAEAQRHDVATARRLMAAAPRAVVDDTADFVDADALEALVSDSLEDWAGVAARLAPMFTEADPVKRMVLTTSAAPLLAVALARTGDVPRAEALLAEAPADAYDAAVARARVAAIKGDVARSEQLFTAADRLAPSLADATYWRGEARLARGDRAGAIVSFREAAGRAPRWAEPLKGWGDALAGSGDARGAIGKYRAAAERAPAWGGLHLAWGRALAASGRSGEAHDQYRLAAGYGLSKADRAEARRRLASGQAAR